MNATNIVRTIAVVAWVVVVGAALIGWWHDKDPSQLAPVISWVTAALAVGEGANIGKRATWKREAHEAHIDAVRSDG